MSQVQSTTQVETKTMSRLTWVLNQDGSPYKAEFQGMEITIPANRQKIFKHVREGGNLMEYLAASKFKSDYKMPQGFHKDGSPIYGPKALYLEEMTDEESAKVGAKSKAELKKLELVEEKKVRRKVKEALDKIPEGPHKTAASDDEE